jgi:Polyketide cyclase / dehydrase and lipid transport
MISRIAMGFLALTVALTSAAGAVEVKRKIKVKGDAATVWSKIGGWCAISEWHPAIAKCVESQVGGKPHRTLTTKDGGVIEETQFAKSDHSYSYTIDESPLPVKDYKATFSVVPRKRHADKAKIIWSAKFDAKGESAAARKVIDGIFKAGLDQIKQTTN